ncbi:MAG: Gfo/Idh/MocA family oxidoreductase [Epsilonproteobacteria bacterium]|nr:Gfo/Idh/MocA family oxidoreductase [Campylobacterota bacterium]
MYKLAFIGGSIDSIAGYPHFIASQMDKKFEVLSGTFSTDAAINKATAKQWKIERCYDDYQSLIAHEKDRIDAVVILTPTPLHSQMIIDLLQANIPIICEKPLVGSLEEVAKIKKIYDPSKHFLVVTNNYSGYPMLRELRRKIASNELGEILSIRLKMPQESFLRPPKSVKYPQKWRLQDAFIPMINLDLGSHLHHLAYFLLHEEPTSVMAHYSSFSKYDVIDDVNMLLHYKSGISGNLWLSKTALGNRNGLHIEVYGTKASASWHQETPELLEFSYNTGEKTIIDRGSDIEIPPNTFYNRMTPGHPAGFIESFANIYNDIATALDKFHKKQPYLSEYIYGIDHAHFGLKLLHSASVANQQSTFVTIANGDTH